jgi:hypothetical protein
MIDLQFFRNNQSKLLFILNVPVIGMLFRRIMWIEDYKNKVVCVTPNAYHVRLRDGRFRYTGRASDHYSEALFKNLNWLWRLAHEWDMLVANRLVPALNLGFDSYTSQPDETNSNDTFMSNGFPGNNYGGLGEMYLGNNTGGDNNTERDLVKFDLSSLPASISVSAATYSMWMFTKSAANSRTARLYRVLRDWEESTCSWNNWKTSTAWTTAGCSSDGNDYNSTSLASYAYSSSESNGQKQYSFNSSGYSNIQDIASGSISNYGWLIRMDTEVDDRYVHRAANYATASERPKLEITYTEVVGGNPTIFYF